MRNIKSFMFAAALCLAGCSVKPANVSSEKVAKTHEALTNTCTQSGADDTWNETGSDAFSAYDYNYYCYDAVVVDVDNIQIGNPTYSDAGVYITWDDTVPTNSNDCTAATVSVMLFNWYDRDGLGYKWYFNTYTPYTSHGVWSGGVCTPPTVLFPTSTGALINGQTYRFESEATDGVYLKGFAIYTQSGF